MEIIEGKLNPPIKAVIYGPEGIGKSTLASKAPGALFIDTEGGTSYLDVRRITGLTSWEELLADVKEVAKTPGICQTLIIDTADKAEALCIKHICEKHRVNGIESFGYGKGYTYIGEEMSRLLEACDEVIAAGMNVIILAHAKMRKQELPDEQGAFDRWELKVTRQSAPLLKEWSDLLLFLTYKTVVVTTENNTKKAAGGKRVMKTTHSPVWDAKNRFDLPEEMDLDFAGIADLFKGSAPEATAQSETPLEKLRAMMAEAQVTAEDVQRVVGEYGYYPTDTAITEYSEIFITGCISNWPKVLTLIKNHKNEEDNKNE